MSITRSKRRVITFYSYKGGVGRTMALANVAFRLADIHALDVVVVDWDLEAPGLHEFFQIPRETLAASRGVLDYLDEWRAAAKRRDPQPPNAKNWLIPIIKGTSMAPRHGSLSLLIAGKLDHTYDARLAALDWKEFYEKASGALAVETLRKQLVEDADVVLIDSRTGLTDAGGICTIQLPDAVVLMTTPNRQSLEGVERVARSIAKATPLERAGRLHTMTWLSVCRMPSLEDTHAAGAWFKDHTPEFERMITEGVLEREAHWSGLGTHSIPQHSRWGFDEALLTEDRGAARSDPLLGAYERLAVTILNWSLSLFDEVLPLGDAPAREPLASVEELEARAKAAEDRRDVPSQLAALVLLGDAFQGAKRPSEAERVLRRAGDVALGAGLLHHRAVIKLRLASALEAQRDHADAALAEAQAALDLGEELNSASIRAQALGKIAVFTAKHQSPAAAIPYFIKAIGEERVSGRFENALSLLAIMVELGAISTDQRNVSESMLRLAPGLTDEDLRRCFEHLEAGEPAPRQLSPAKPKRTPRPRKAPP